MNNNEIKLFKDIYNVEPKNNEQIETMLEYLQDRLSHSEKEYIQENYSIDLFSEDEVRKTIFVKMKHPVIISKLFTNETKDEVEEIYEKCLDKEKITISYIQRTFNKGFVSAKGIIDELERRGKITPTNNGMYKLVKWTSEK